MSFQYLFRNKKITAQLKFQPVSNLNFNRLIFILALVTLTFGACEKYDLDLFRAEESTKISAYLESISYTTAETYIAPGIYYMHGKTGIGKPVSTADSVVIAFKVYTLNPASATAAPSLSELYGYTAEKPYIVIPSKSKLVDGFKTGMWQMREGDTAEFVVPFDLAYGPSQNGPIPGLSTLVFKISSVKTFKK